ncbi:uncharacterized acetyltransferase At3g50280-like [Salvia hispanica]|uniref:uncharacterized acetyltransferase At3g50280-like n=1 Tax=Salvia hispanica TaxID=49212 RepID=UPI00200912BC|nr:uncharacterized acetyltransferase At3g50280-like [Salvia hispanica]
MAENVKVVSSSLVCGTASNSLSRLELNPWDIRAFQTVPIQRCLIFHNPNFEFESLIQHLKNSLSRALDFFPPLAGRLVATQHGDGMASFSVDCNNDGAEFIHAIAPSISVSEVIDPPSFIPEVVYSFFPANAGFTNFEGISKPLVSVQVTELADGVVIACSANHVVIDGPSFWHFFTSWSEISRGSESISKSPVFDRSIAAEDNRRIHLPTLEKNLIGPSQLPRKVFHFSKEKLGELKGKANSEMETDKISTLQALLAHLWRSTVGSSEDSTTRTLALLIGARSRLSSFSDAYFGNAFFPVALAMSGSDLWKGGLGGTAMKINQLIAQTSNEAISRNAEKKVEPRIRREGEEKVVIHAMGSAPPIVITSTPRHNVYDCDFGWGKPIAMRSGYTYKVEGLVVVFPAADPGGMDLEVCFAEQTLQTMEDYLTSH